MHLPDNASAVFHETPLLITLQGAWGHVAHPSIMHPLGVASGRPEQSRDRVFGDVDQASGCPHPAPCAHMINDGRGVCLRDLRVEPRGAASLGELLATEAAPEEPDAVLAVDFADSEIALAGETKPLAFGIDTR